MQILAADDLATSRARRVLPRSKSRAAEHCSTT